MVDSGAVAGLEIVAGQYPPLAREAKKVLSLGDHRMAMRFFAGHGVTVLRHARNLGSEDRAKLEQLIELADRADKRGKPATGIKIQVRIPPDHLELIDRAGKNRAATIRAIVADWAERHS